MKALYISYVGSGYAWRVWPDCSRPAFHVSSNYRYRFAVDGKRATLRGNKDNRICDVHRIRVDLLDSSESGYAIFHVVFFLGRWLLTNKYNDLFNDRLTYR